ncbi:MAG TPA: hypothetical protein PLN21_06960 [Gemmatales bacterium]|nr:hypothetical protein [Gemmatales bacterium]
MARAFSVLVLVVCAALAFADDPVKSAQSPDTPSSLVVAQQTVQQKLAQAETRRTAQRLEAMLRVLSYHQLDAAAEQKIINEAASALRGLSQQQMEEIIKNFSTASQAKTLAEMDKQLDQAQDKHRVVLDQIRQLLARFEMVRNVEQAAQRFDKLAVEQGQLKDRVLQSEQQRRAQTNQRRGMRPESPQQHALRQDDLARESDAVLQKLHEIQNDIPDELKPRLEKAFEIANERHMLNVMRDAANHLRYRNQQEAEDRQIQAKNDLERLARTLRTPSDKLGVLQEARDRVQKLLEQQNALKDQSVTAKDPRQADAKKEPLKEREQTAARKSARQAEVMVQTRDVKELLTEIAKDTAQTLEQSAANMQAAKDQLRASQQQQALEPQTKAAEKLAEAKKQLDELVVAEEKSQRDPLAALQRAMEQIDKIIAEQKALQHKNKESILAKKPTELKPTAPKQQNLAQKTEEIVAKPLAAKAETKQMIQNAAEAMHAASEQLHAQEGESAIKQQDKALADLAQAKAALQAEAQAMAERREQIEQLEKAGKKLDDIIQKESEIHDAAKQLDKQEKAPARAASSEKLAQQQDQAKAQTDELAKDLKKTAPDASKKSASAAEKMNDASKALKADQLPQAATESQKALDHLDQAKKSLNDTLSEKQAEEAAAEAMQNPDKIQPGEAAVHVAKALMESKEAAKQSAQAAKDPAQSSQSMKQSEAATKSAQAAIDQARAMSPQNVQPSLGQARQQLNQAQQNLKNNTPSTAQKNQEQAAAQLNHALQSLQQIQQAMDKMQGDQQNAQNQSEKGKEGEKGQQQTKGKPQDGQAKNDKTAQNDNKDKNQTGDPSQNGERDGNAKAEKGDVKGKSTFVNLPARQRELIMQALSEKLPPEHAAQIQRYFESIAGGKPAGETKKK